ncbi:MAG: MMPL family transporter [Candidatus Methanoperedens sp.]|nr:MMPL family transporter [Candidatus Methanoperedens sp.]
MDRIIERYSGFVCRHPYLVLLMVFIISISAIYFSGTIEMKTSSDRDFLPENEPVVDTLFAIEDEFGSTNTVYIIVDAVPQHTGSNEVHDVRDPRSLRYIDNIAALAMHTDDVIEVMSPASVIKSINNGRLPGSLRESQELTYKNGLLDSYISRDYSQALVKVQTTDDVNLDTLELELGKLIGQVIKPPGIETNLGGTILEQQVMKNNIQPDMARTTTYSIIGILAIVLLLFRSLKYGLTPLSTIIFGSLWAMGFVGLIGMGLSSTTSGVLSMIMGIGIDFGIQVVTRYRMELPGKTPEKAMAFSLSNVIIPMSTTTLAALVGFQALHLGKLTFMGEMGTMMSYGVAASMAAAITVVPASIIIFDTMELKKTIKKLTEVRT